MRVVVLGFLLFALPMLPVRAEEALGLSAPSEVFESGLLQHILPRFSLKTGVRVVADSDGDMTLSTVPPGVPVFRGGDVLYHLRTDDTPRQTRFRDWMLSEIGKRTISSFQSDGVSPFSGDVGTVVVQEAILFEGDVARGETLSLTHCGRCHVINARNRHNGIGSTPSFAVLRSLQNWDTRFQQFYVLAPHGAFTQIEDVTEPFDPHLPSPIHPVRITWDEVEAILAFVAALGPADLGAPLQLQ